LRYEYNDERPKRSLGRLTPTQYAKQVTIKAVTLPDDSEALRYCKACGRQRYTELAPAADLIVERIR
jgi:hypothetical protein